MHRDSSRADRSSRLLLIEGPMDNAEKIALKAACVQAAAILVAAQPQPAPLGRSAGPAPDTGACVRFARDLFGKLTGEAWD